MKQSSYNKGIRLTTGDHGTKKPRDRKVEAAARANEALKLRQDAIRARRSSPTS